MADLITLAQAHDYLKIPDLTTSDDTQIQAFIDGASQAFLTITSLPYVLTTSFTERRDGTGTATITTKNRPLQTITRLVISNLTIPPSADGVSPGYYFNPGDIRIALVGGYNWQNKYFAAIGFGGYPGKFIKGYGNVFITGTAGFGATVPLDIQQCVCEMVAWAYKERDRIGVTTERFADNLSQSYAKTPFSERAKLTIQRYTRKDAVGW